MKLNLSLVPKLIMTGYVSLLPYVHSCNAQELFYFPLRLQQLTTNSQVYEREKFTVT